MDEIIFTPDKTFVQYANGEDLEWQMCRLKIFCKEEKIILKISKNDIEHDFEYEEHSSNSKQVVIDDTADDTIILFFYELKNAASLDKAINNLMRNNQTKITATKERLNLDQMAFQVNFKENRNYVKNQIEEYIRNCHNKWSRCMIFAPIGFILQSSGYGKTRILNEYAKKHMTILLCLREQGGEEGFPPRSSLSFDFFQAIANKKLDSLLAAMVKTTMDYVGNQTDKIDDLARDFCRIQPWISNDRSKKSQKRPDFTIGKFVDDVDDYCRAFSNDSQKRQEAINQFMKKDFSLLFVIDEAHLLIERQHNDETYYELFYKCIQQMFRCCRTVFILTSTNVSFAEFPIRNTYFSSSARTVVKSDYLPFSKLVFTDQLTNKTYLSCFSKSTDNIYNNVINRDPFDTIFKFGRPLWASRLQAIDKIHKIDSDYSILDKQRELLTFARDQLIKNSDWNNSSKLLASLAIFGCTTCLLSSVSVNKRLLTLNLIDKHMATLVKMDDIGNVLHMRYVSEPILAEAAAYFMSDTKILYEALVELNKAINSTAIDSTSNIGELVAEIIVLTAKNKKTTQTGNLHSKAINVKDFLNSLIGKKGVDAAFSNQHHKIFDGSISFTHFIHQLDRLQMKDIRVNLLARCAAARLADNFKSFDLLIPVVFPNNKVGAILIQVKNQATCSSYHFGEDLSQTDAFSTSDIKWNNEHCLKIVMNFGQQIEENNCVPFQFNEDGVLIISGLSLDAYPCLKHSIQQQGQENVIVDQLKLLLDLQRSNIKYMTDIDSEIKRRVLGGAYSSSEPI